MNTPAQRAAAVIKDKGVSYHNVKGLTEIIEKEYNPLLEMALGQLERLLAEANGPCPACVAIRTALGRK